MIWRTDPSHKMARSDWLVAVAVQTGEMDRESE